MLFLSWDLEYTDLVTNLGPVPFVPLGTSRESRGEVKTIHNEKASTFHETLEVGVKDADNLGYRGPVRILVAGKYFATVHFNRSKYLRSFMFTFQTSF